MTTSDATPLKLFDDCHECGAAIHKGSNAKGRAVMLCCSCYNMTCKNNLQIKKLSNHAQLPKRGSSRAAGYDLFAAESLQIEPYGKALVKTDIAVAHMPDGYYGRIAPRSSLAWKKHLDVGAGVIDGDYRGPIGIVLFNLGKEAVNIFRGDRVAQLILEKITTPDVLEVNTLPKTDRGNGGFGSTGK